jgi:4'-phosphopantetheinyl transferase EntD
MQLEKILRISNNFTTFEDYNTLAKVDAVMSKLTIVWGAKESLYKLYAQEGLSFLKHIYIDDFYFDTGKTTGSVTFNGNPSHYKLDFLEFEGFTCVYALPA